MQDNRYWEVCFCFCFFFSGPHTEHQAMATFVKTTTPFAVADNSWWVRKSRLSCSLTVLPSLPLQDATLICGQSDAYFFSRVKTFLLHSFAVHICVNEIKQALLRKKINDNNPFNLHM